MYIKPIANSNGWVQTDDNQFVKQLSDSRFEIYNEVTYGENNEYTEIFFDEIDVDDYSDNLEKEIKGYYSSVNEVKEIYGSDWKMIVAEIIAEQSEHEYKLDDFIENEE